MAAKKSKGKKKATLIYANSEQNADQLYIGGVFVPDPFISFIVDDRSYAVVNALEYSRMCKSSRFDEILSLEDYRIQAVNKWLNADPGPDKIIRLISKEFGIDTFIIAQDFPAGLALTLKKKKISLKVMSGSVFPQREMKNDEEAEAIRLGNRASIAGLRTAEKMIRQAEIVNGRLYFNTRPLTSEKVKTAIELACLQAGAIATHTIVAGGKQACDPHCEGYGPLRAHELIIVDVFPRLKKSGYYGDMTRTFLKGRASEKQKKLVSTVQGAQQEALDSIRAGVSGIGIHQQVQAHFARQGYKTRRTTKGYEGFFHGTGHGLGLEVHEPPRVNPNGAILETGHVVTVEPGLYYPGLGGSRIEDVVRVKEDGCEMLSNYHYRWKLR